MFVIAREMTILVYPKDKKDTLTQEEFEIVAREIASEVRAKLDKRLDDRISVRTTGVSIL